MNTLKQELEKALENAAIYGQSFGRIKQDDDGALRFETIEHKEIYKETDDVQPDLNSSSAKRS